MKEKSEAAHRSNCARLRLEFADFAKYNWREPYLRATGSQDAVELDALSHSRHPGVRYQLASNPHLYDDTRNRLLKDLDLSVMFRMREFEKNRMEVKP